MEIDQEICGICREVKCDFETRCGHLFHEECLESAIFSRDSDNCPYCWTKITSLRLFEKLIRKNGDFSNIKISPDDLDSLKEVIKYVLASEHKIMPIEPIVLKMFELGWDIDENDFWIEKEKVDFEHSLFYASYISGNLDVTYKLIELGCKIVKKNNAPMGVDVFYKAVIKNDVEFIKKLISLGLDISSVDIAKVALKIACMNDNADMVEFLLNNGAKLAVLTGFGAISLKYCTYTDDEFHNRIEVNALITSCFSGSLNTIRCLHTHIPDILLDSSISWAAFAVAIMHENINLIDLLIECGGDINSVDREYKRNLFMIACKYGKINVMKHVFDNGSFDINTLDALGNSALLYSLSIGKNCLELVKYLIQKGADPLTSTRHCNLTALHIACLENMHDVVEYFLTDEACSSIDLKSIQPARSGLLQSSLSLYCENKMDIIDIILKRGIGINEKNLNGVTAFPYAVDCSRETLIFLLSRGSDVNSVDARGSNCLQNIMGENLYCVDKRLVEVFINHGINLNNQNEWGDTVMHCCFTKPFELNVVELLLDSGARTDIPNAYGEFPLDYALLCDPFAPNIEMLENRGLNYGKDIPDVVKSKSCDHCSNNSSSLKARCGHHLHIHCLKDKTKCPICDIRITISNKLEKMMMEECNFDNLESLSDLEIFILLDEYIEDESIINFETITDELKRRKDLKKDRFKFPEYVYNIEAFPEDLFAKACDYERIKLVKFLSSIGLDNSVSYSKVSSVALASISGNIELVEHFIEKFGAQSINQVFDDRLPIYFACMYGHLQLFDYLIERGAYLDIDNDEMNLLNLACSVGSLEIVKRLIEDYEADPNVPDYMGMSALHYSATGSEYYLNQNAFRKKQVHQKTEEECIEIAKYLLENGADINEFNIDLQTPVAYTGICNREKLFDFYLDYFENVLQEPLNLHEHQVLSCIALCGKNLDFFERIIKMGVDVNWTNRKGFTALMAACSSGNYEMCSRLIELGANVNAREFEEYETYPGTALIYLCQDDSDNLEILELLIEHHADINQTTVDGENLLHLAAKHSCLNIVKKLLAIGFDPNSLSSNLQTPLHSCLYHSNTEKTLPVVSTLIEAGADYNVLDGLGFTPMTLATEMGWGCLDLEDYFNTFSQ